MYQSSVVDLLLHPLDAVVPVGRPVVCRTENDVPHFLRRLDFAQVQQKPRFQVFQRFDEETGQS
jgi:hypothetical protein